MSVVFPEPLGPSRPNTSPRRTSSVTQSTAVNVPNRIVTSRTSMTAWSAFRPLACCGVEGLAGMRFGRRICLPHRQPHVGSHARFEDALRIGHADLEAKDLVPPLVDRLHVAGREF